MEHWKTLQPNNFIISKLSLNLNLYLTVLEVNDKNNMLVERPFEIIFLLLRHQRLLVAELSRARHYPFYKKIFVFI